MKKRILSLLICAMIVISFAMPMEIFAQSYDIEGPETVYVLSKDQITKVDYLLCDELGSAQSGAVFSLDGSYEDIFITKDGQLYFLKKTSSAESIEIKASYGGNTYTKTVSIKTGFDKNMNTYNECKELFWSSVVSAGEYKQKSDNDYYIDPLSSNRSFKTGSQYGTDAASSSVDEFTVSLDIMPTDTAIQNAASSWQGAVCFQGFAQGNAGGNWETISFGTKSGANVELKSLYGSLGSYKIGQWLNVKIKVNSKEGYHKVYINDEYKVTCSNYGTNAVPFISAFVLRVPFDNVMMYTGDIIYPEKLSSQMINSPLVQRPEEGMENTLSLEASVSYDSQKIDSYPVVWSLKENYEGVSLNKNVITVTDEAPMEFEVYSEPKGGAKKTYKLFCLKSGEENVLLINGSEDIVIPLSSDKQVRYTAKDIFSNPVTPKWSIEPEGSGVSVSSSGVVTVTPSASEGIYTLKAEIDGKEGTLDISLTYTNLLLTGAEKIMIPDKSTYVKIPYSLTDSDGNSYKAQYSLSDDIEGCMIDSDGILRIFGADLDSSSSLDVIASFGNIEKRLPLSFVNGYSEDFSNASWTNSSYIKTEDNNKYLSAMGSRTDSPEIMLDTDMDSFTVQFRYKADNVARTVNLGGASQYSDTTGNTSFWWMVFSAVRDGNEDTLDLSSSSSKIVSNKKYTTDSDWINVKIAISTKSMKASLFIDDNFISTGDIYSDFCDLRVKNIINYAAIDDVKVYSGEAANENNMEIIPTPPATVPGYKDNRESVIPLTAIIKDNGKIIENHPALWTCLTEGKKSYIENGRLHIADEGLKSIDLSLQIPSTGVSENITLNITDASFTMEYKNGNIVFSGNPNDKINLTLYKPLDTTDMNSAFLKSGDKDVKGSTYDNLSIDLDLAGHYSFSVSSYPPGLYTVYASDMSGVESCIEIINRFEDILNSKNAKNNINSESSFKKLLIKYTSLSSKEVDELYDMYKSSDNKDRIIKMTNTLDDFLYSVNLVNFEDEVKNNSSYPKDAQKDLENLLSKNDNYDESIINLVGKNYNPKSVIEKMLEDDYSNIEDYLASLEENAILCGLKKVIHVDDAKVFLERLGNKNYNSASPSQKSYICKEIANREYSDLSDLQSAVSKVKLPDESSSGGSSSFGPGGSGSGSQGTVSSKGTLPSVSDTENTDITYTDITKGHWAYDSVMDLTLKGIVSGSDKKFRPDDNITRAEFTKILCMAYNLPLVNGSAFDDVTSSDWFAPYVNAAAKNNLAQGYEGKFNPFDNITREDAAVLAYRFSQKYSSSLKAGTASFADSDKISDYALSSVENMAFNKILTGFENGEFMPKNNMTRAEAAKMLCGLIKGGNVK